MIVMIKGLAECFEVFAWLQLICGLPNAESHLLQKLWDSSSQVRVVGLVKNHSLPTPAEEE